MTVAEERKINDYHSSLKRLSNPWLIGVNLAEITDMIIEKRELEESMKSKLRKKPSIV